MDPFRILIVEDDNWYGEFLEHHLSLNPEYAVQRCTTGKQALQLLKEKPDVMTLDFNLPDMSGMDLLRRVRSSSPDTQVIVISGQEDVKTAVALFREGSCDYIIKDSETQERLWKAMQRIRENKSLQNEVDALRREIGMRFTSGLPLIGESTAMQDVFALVGKAAKSNISVSLTGETGTGKDLVAKAIHLASERRDKPFVAVNMAAIPSELAESELFGHEKGAFTDAAQRKIGKFEEANGGTLFLDEIGEMEPGLQSKLLRVLQERELTRVGGNEIVKLDIRVIAATHRDLGEQVQQKNFREDLYYRLLGLPIELPPLRERGKDTLLLARYFIDLFCAENSLPIPALSSDAAEKLISHRYPGNIRELKALIEMAIVLCNRHIITADDIHFRTPLAANILADEATLEEYLKRILKNYLSRYNNNIQLVANKLDIGRSTVYRMLRSV